MKDIVSKLLIISFLLNKKENEVDINKCVNYVRPSYIGHFEEVCPYKEYLEVYANNKKIALVRKLK